MKLTLETTVKIKGEVRHTQQFVFGEQPPMSEWWAAQKIRQLAFDLSMKDVAIIHHGSPHEISIGAKIEGDQKGTRQMAYQVGLRVDVNEERVLEIYQQAKDTIAAWRPQNAA